MFDVNRLTTTVHYMCIFSPWGLQGYTFPFWEGGMGGGGMMAKDPVQSLFKAERAYLHLTYIYT